MTLADQARENAIPLEVKKDGLQQRQSGDWVLRVVIAAADMHQRIINAPMGARFQVALVEINDDESPVDHRGQDRERWRDLGPTQQAGMRCNEPIFWGFLTEECGYSVDSEASAATAVRDICGITSRKELSQPSRMEARRRWHDLDHQYQAWKAAEHA